MITLYCESLFDSPFVFTAWVALKEKGVDFSEHVFDLSTGEHKAGEFAEKSMTARVPTLRHQGANVAEGGDLWISESVAICEYLDEAFEGEGRPTLMGNTPAERARVRQVLGWLRSDLRGLRADRSTESMFLGEENADLSEKGAADTDRLYTIAQRLVQDGRPFLVENFSIADADLAFMLHRLILNGDPMPDGLKAYAEKIWQRPSVQSYVNHAR
jgi:glutathione S-transferase